MFEKLSFVDLETTGGRVNYDRIIEIGIVKIEDGVVSKKYTTLVNPQMHLPAFIEQMTGISATDLETAPPFEEVMDEVIELLEDSIFVAHNVRFDYGFLKNEFKRFGHSYSAKHFCSARLSKLLFPQHRHHNLDSLIERFGITCQRRHRALDDALATYEFYKSLPHHFSQEQLENVIATIIKKPSIPSSIPQEQIENLPSSPGVYIFYDEAGMPLYVGKSINIRDRVLSHFNGDYTSSKEMNISQQIASLETIKTAGELGALFKESALIKELQPLYNRQLRIKRRLLIAEKRTDPQGYYIPVLKEVDCIDPETSGLILGIFKSRKQAQDHMRLLVKEYGLCEKLLQLEKSKGPCFAYKLQWCNGACNGKESSIEYNARFEKAFEQTRIRPWPYHGAVAITERDQINQLSQTFVVDNWCLLGSIITDEYGGENLQQFEQGFDTDVYKILSRFINSHKAAYMVKPMNRPVSEILTPVS